MEDQRIQYLMQRLLTDACRPEEKAELMRWLEQPGHEVELQQMLEHKWGTVDNNQAISPGKADAILSSILETQPAQSSRSAKLFYIHPWRFAAAFILMIGLGLLSYFFIFRHSTPTITGTQNNIAVKKQAIHPGKTGALLTLSNGAQIVLDTAANGPFALQGNSKISKSSAGLSYTGKVKPDGEILYNNLITHRGEQYALVLSDGTKVWLNAASSIRFPVSFSGKRTKGRYNRGSLF